MPLSMQFCADNQTIIVTAVGVVNTGEICRMIRLLFADGRLRDGMNAIWDFRTARAPLSAADVMEIAFASKNSSRARGTVKTAIVVAGSNEYGLARLLEAHLDVLPAHISTFRDMNKATRWLSDRSSHDPLDW